MPEPPNEFPYHPPNVEKTTTREDLLKVHPELKIRVDIKKLREIIDFSDFKCDPNSSVARDRAIRGSDIDGGVVYTKTKTTLPQEMTFIEELRRQGFDVYHPSEYDESLRRYEKLSLEEKIILARPRESWGHTKMSTRLIRFHTQQEIDREIREARTHEVGGFKGFSDAAIMFSAGKSLARYQYT